jgi:hypothetical protein
MVRRFRALLWKWLWCFWAHRHHKCFPTVWGPEQAKEMGIPYRPNAWHCTKCHPCNEGLDRLMDESPNSRISETA